MDSRLKKSYIYLGVKSLHRGENIVSVIRPHSDFIILVTVLVVYCLRNKTEKRLSDVVEIASHTIR